MAIFANSPLFYLSHTCFAQALHENTDNSLPQKELLNFNGLMQVDITNHDSQNKNEPSFSAVHARAGVNGQKGIVTAKLGVEFAGNQPYTQKVKQEPVADSNKYSSPSNNAAVLRQAQIDLHILPYNSNEYLYSTVISVGGIRLGMAYGTAPDSANWPTGFGRQDGLHIQENIQHNKQMKMSIGAGVFNTLAGSTPGKTYQGWYNNYAITAMSPWLNTAVNKDLAYVVDTNFNLHIDAENTLNITDYFGIQNNAPYLIDYATGEVAQVRDVNHTEASIIFNNTKILGNKGLVSGNGLSLWYEREQNSRTKIVTMTPSNDYQYTNGLVNDAQIASLYGIGIAGDTSHYYSSIFYPTDRYTYAAAYTYVYSQFDDSNYALNYAVHQLAVSFGYAVETFEVALNVEYSVSPSQIFVDTHAQPKQYEAKSYFTFMYIF